MKKLLAVAVVAELIAGSAQAALWNSAWSGETYTSIGDAVYAGGGVNDIIQLESIFGAGSEGVGYYFRMTLADTGPKDNAYMLNFNTDNNTLTGGNANNSTYLGTGLQGIDAIIDTHYDGGLLGHSHYHTYSYGSSPNANYTVELLSGVGGAYEEVTGTQLEWYVPPELVPSGSILTGSIVDIGTAFAGDNATVTHDLTGNMSPIPEPTGLALLALGVAVIGLRRKIRG